MLVIKGLSAEDLRWWRGDHIVSHGGHAYITASVSERPCWKGKVNLERNSVGRSGAKRNEGTKVLRDFANYPRR